MKKLLLIVIIAIASGIFFLASQDIPSPNQQITERFTYEELKAN